MKLFYTLPPVGRVGRVSGRGGGRGMLIVGAVAKALTTESGATGLMVDISDRVDG
jgi:hypothetical protein